MKNNYFLLTDDQQDLREMVRDFAEKEIIPKTAPIDVDPEVMNDLFHKAYQMGLTTFTLPEEYGGGGGTIFDNALIKEELARGDAGFAANIAVCYMATVPVKIAGTKEQMQWIADRLTAGERGSFALTEPNSGSDAASLTTRYKREGEYFILNGRKGFITGAEFASFAVVFATMDPSLRAKGISAFLVDMKSPGVSVTGHEDKLGFRTSATNDVVFEDVKVPVQNLIGEEGKGFSIAMTSLGYTRPSSGAGAVGNAQYAFECAVEYSKVRKTFGKPICKHQSVAFMLADMYAKLESARQLVWHTCRCADAGIRDSRLASAAKFYASDAAMQVCTDAVQILGGYGYSREYPLEKLLRDARIYSIFEGTNQVQRQVIGKTLLG